MRALFVCLSLALISSVVGCSDVNAKFAGDMMQEINAAGWQGEVEVSGPVDGNVYAKQSFGMGTAGHFAVRLRSPATNPAPGVRPDYNTDAPNTEDNSDGQVD